MNDLISRQAAIATAISGRVRTLPTTEDGENWIRVNEVRDSLLSLPSAQSEHPSEIQDILDYLDTALHPIISPEYWNVYSELHDMISTLPSAERREGQLSECEYWDDESNFCTLHRPSAELHGRWVDIPFTARWICSNCDYISEFASFKYCPDCGAIMDLEDEE